MNMLMTAIQEIETSAELEKIISENESVMVSCGRMGPMCIPVYDVMEELTDERPEIKFYTIAFDNPQATIIRNAPMCNGFMGLPFNVYYKNGEMVKATSSIQSREQIVSILDEEFGN